MDKLRFRDDNFFLNGRAQRLILKLRYDEHASGHMPSCYKKSNECIFNQPIPASKKAFIYVDEGVKKKKRMDYFERSNEISSTIHIHDHKEPMLTISEL